MGSIRRISTILKQINKEEYQWESSISSRCSITSESRGPSETMFTMSTPTVAQSRRMEVTHSLRRKCQSPVILSAGQTCQQSPVLFLVFSPDSNQRNAEHFAKWLSVRKPWGLFHYPSSVGYKGILSLLNCLMSMWVEFRMSCCCHVLILCVGDS